MSFSQRIMLAGLVVTGLVISAFTVQLGPETKPDVLVGPVENTNTIHLAGVTNGGELSAKKLETATELQLLDARGKAVTEHQIKSFKLSIVNGDKIIEVMNQGAELGAEARQLLGRADEGQKIYIERIKVLHRDGLVRAYDPVIITIS